LVRVSRRIQRGPLGHQPALGDTDEMSDT